MLFLFYMLSQFNTSVERILCLSRVATGFEVVELSTVHGKTVHTPGQNNDPSVTMNMSHFSYKP